jgi:hypothetical protein
MKKYRIPIAIGLLLAPLALRTIWFYQGFFWRWSPVASPDYASFSVPQPPLSTPIAQPEGAHPAATKIILVDQSHSNFFSMSELDALAAILNNRGAKLEGVGSSDYYGYGNGGGKSLNDQLKYSSAFISICPLSSYSTYEVQWLQDFVKRGGRLLILTDPTRSSISYDYYSGYSLVTTDVTAANSLLSSFDITFNDDYLYNMSDYEGNFRNVYFRSFGANPLTANVSEVVLYAAHSLYTKTGTLLISSTGETKSSLTDANGTYSAAALDASGQILAIGDMTFLTNPYNHVADNGLFIQHVVDFLLGSERVHNLSDFPYLFQRPVVINLMKDLDLDAGLLGSINGLLQDLRGAGITIDIAQAPVDGKDLILLATFDSPGISTYAQISGVTLPSMSLSREGDGPYIEIPGLGKVSAYGVSLILFQPTESRSTLILITEDIYSLESLLGTIGSGGISGCYLQENIAVCGLSSGYYGY